MSIDTRTYNIANSFC